MVITRQQFDLACHCGPQELECKMLSTRVKPVAYIAIKNCCLLQKYLHAPQSHNIKLYNKTEILHFYLTPPVFYSSQHKHTSDCIWMQRKLHCCNGRRVLKFLYSSLNLFYIIDYDMCPQEIIII